METVNDQDTETTSRQPLTEAAALFIRQMKDVLSDPNSNPMTRAYAEHYVGSDEQN